MAAAPVPRVDMDPVFELRVRELVAHAKAEYEQLQHGGQVRWFRPAGWAGDLHDAEGFGPPFSAEVSTASAVEAMADGDNPGTTGDIVAGLTMAEYLAAAERAFRARLTGTGPRDAAHALGRKKGHGQDSGAFGGSALEYVRRLLEMSKS